MSYENNFLPAKFNFERCAFFLISTHLYRNVIISYNFYFEPKSDNRIYRFSQFAVMLTYINIHIYIYLVEILFL
jgi:hypothetical protein